MSPITTFFAVTAVMAIAGCTTLPTGPNVMVLPGTGVSFDKFRTDDTLCEQYAASQIGAATSANASSSTDELQERYDVAYVQCMYTKGHRVPISGPFSDLEPHGADMPPAHIPPPPTGAPPRPPRNAPNSPGNLNQ
jgi:hypothetical protein